MLLYTPYPIEMVLEGYDTARSIEEISYKGVSMQVESLDNKSYKIIRLISSNPNDFLNPELQPGKIIEASLQAGDI